MLAIDTERLNPERFGTVSHQEGRWAIVTPFNEKMRQRALSHPDAVTEVYR